MEQAIEKFISFAEKKLNIIKEIVNECQKQKANKNTKIMLEKQEISLYTMQQEIRNLEKLLDFLKMPEEDAKKKHTIYKHYSYVSLYLDVTEFNAKERMEIILYVFQKNNASFLMEPDSIHEVLELNTFKELYAPNMSMEKFDEWASNIDFVKIGNTPTDLLNTEEQRIKEKAVEATEQTGKENKIFMLMHDYIQKHYFDKKESYTEQDLKFISTALKNVNVSPKIVSSTIRILTKEMNKREVGSQKICHLPEKIEYDYKSLEKEVSEVIDLKDMKPKHYLSLEEKVYYLSLLTRMNVSKEERSLFLRNCEMVLEEVSPLREYVENYNRLKYYEESVGLQKEIAFMEECFTEMLLCSHEDYYFWRQSLEETLKQVEHWIPKNYEYEESEASRLLVK